MKIVVNTRYLRKDKLDGIGWFTYYCIKYITQKNQDIQFYLLFDSTIDKEFVFADNVTPIKLFPPAKHALLNIIWFEYSVKRVLKKIKPDLFLSPDGILCLGWKHPQFSVIHDINYVHLPKDLKLSNSLYFNYFFPKYAKIAKRIATVSQYSKNDIVANFHVPPEKIDVVYNGVKNRFSPVSEEKKREIRNKFSEGKPYFVFVGTLHPRKNIARLIQSFGRFKQEVPNDTKLILAGWEMYRTNELHELRDSLSCKDDIIFTGRVGSEEIYDLVAGAFCMSFVPYFEGFGVPPLEAMGCNVPVIASNVTSIPEVVGDAAILVDPYNIEEIKEAMKTIYLNDDIRNDLIAKGAERINLFPWERTAELLWESVKKCLEE